jgi:predicted MFS family arabinose efflux permease
VVGFYGRDEHGLVVCLTAGDTFLFGVDEGSFSPASSVTVAEVFPKPERARAKSFLISTVFLGNAAGSGLIGLTVARLGWRGSFHILAVVGMGVALILWMNSPAASMSRNRTSRRQCGECQQRLSCRQRWGATLETMRAYVDSQGTAQHVRKSAAQANSKPAR